MLVSVRNAVRLTPDRAVRERCDQKYLNETNCIHTQLFIVSVMNFPFLMSLESEVNEGKQSGERRRRKSDSALCVKLLESDVTYMRLQQAERNLHHERERRQQLESETESKTTAAFVEAKDVESIAKAAGTDGKSRGNVYQQFSNSTCRYMD